MNGKQNRSPAYRAIALQAGVEDNRGTPSLESYYFHRGRLLRP